MSFQVLIEFAFEVAPFKIAGYKRHRCVFVPMVGAQASDYFGSVITFWKFTCVRVGVEVTANRVIFE